MSHNLGRSSTLRGPGGVPPNDGGMYTPAAIASSIRLRKRRRRMKERRTIAADTKSSKKRVARKVNLVDVKSESPDEDMAGACATQMQAQTQSKQGSFRYGCVRRQQGSSGCLWV